MGSQADAEDITALVFAFASLPQRHWRQIWSTNPLERVNKESNAAPTSSECSPTPPALLRLAGAVLIERHDEWEAGDRRYFSESSMLELDTMNDSQATVEEVNMIPAHRRLS